MRLGVMSDTHGNIDLMQGVVDEMVNEFDVEAIAHLGDDYADTESLNTHGVKLFAVPGIYEAAWSDRKIPHRMIKEFGGFVFLLSHTLKREKGDGKGDINPLRARESYDADVLLHGHTHNHDAFQGDDGLIVINPGHLKKESDRGRPATYAIVDVDKTTLVVKFVGLGGDVLEQRFFEKGASLGS